MAVGGLLSAAGVAFVVALTTVRVAVGFGACSVAVVGVRVGRVVAVYGTGVAVEARVGVTVEGAAVVGTAEARLAVGPLAAVTPLVGELFTALVAVCRGVGTAIVANPRTTASRVRLGVG